MGWVGWHVELRLREASVDALAELTAEMVAVARDEAGCVAYERFTDGEVIDLFELYRDEDTAIAHLMGFQTRFAPRLNDLVDRVHFHVYGDAGERIVRLCEPYGARRFRSLASLHDATSDAVTPLDIITTATSLAASLAAVDGASFGTVIPGMQWTAQRTLDHVADCLALYSRYVATRATARLEPIRDGRANATIAGLLADAVDAAQMLRLALDTMTWAERAFHPAGLADKSGWSAMACDEILVHGVDIATTVGARFDPDADLVERVVRRLFPWAPDTGTALQRLLWANGRAELEGHPRLDATWYWWCRPVREWDGHRHTRTAPPAW